MLLLNCIYYLTELLAANDSPHICLMVSNNNCEINIRTVQCSAVVQQFNKLDDPLFQSVINSLN